MADRSPRFGPDGSSRPHNPRGRARGVAPSVEEQQQRIETLSLVNVQRGGRSPGGSSGESRFRDDEGGNGNGHGNGNGGNGNGDHSGSNSPPGVRGARRPDVSRDFVPTRPPTMETKQGKSGDSISLLGNYFELQRKKDPSGGTWRLYQYHVDFEPEVERKSLRKGLLKSIESQIGSNISIDGTAVYTSRPLPDGNLEIETRNQRDPETVYKLKIRQVKELNPTDPMYVTFYNILMRTCQQMLNLDEMGRNFYDSKQKKAYPNWKLELWPGFVTVLRQHESRVLLCIEATHKVVRTETVLQVLSGLRDRLGLTDQMKEQAKKELVGSIVMTKYNHKTYRIDEIAWDQRPTDTFPSKEGPVAYKDYYKKKYDITVNLQQPLIVSNPKKRDIHRGMDKPFVLIPELCQMTGLNDALRANFNMMKDLSTHLFMVPEMRMKSVAGFVERVNADEATRNKLLGWGLRIAQRPLEIPGRVMQKEKLNFGIPPNQPEYADEKGDWTMAFRKRQMLACVPLKTWVIIVPDREFAGIDNLIQMMQKVARPLNFELARPVDVKKVRIPNPKSYTDAVRDAMNQHQGRLEMIFVILASNKIDMYAAVKKQTYLEYGIPSQCFLGKNVNSKGLMTIATKVVIQMNAKLGGEPWSVDIPLKGLMVVGFDVYHGATDGKKESIGAMCATLTKNASRYFSTISMHGPNQEVSQNICSDLTKCLTAYQRENGELPGRILFYRDGVGEGQLQYVYSTELENVRQAVKALYESNSLKIPTLTYIVCTKKINARLMAVRNGKCENPPPGTVVDDVITLPERYDFFIVAQNVRQGTVSPTSYHVLTDDSGLDPDKVQKMTFKMCHMYFNWSGTIGVPAPVQYAHKLAFLTGTALRAPAHQSLSNRLYFL